MDQQSIIANLRSEQDIRFPALPETIMRIKQVVDDPESSTGDVVRALTNPSLIVRILQVANSSAMGSRKVDDLTNAVNLLGRNIVRNILVCVAVREAFTCKDLVLSAILRNLWQHSAEIAATTAYLAPKFGVSADTALVAGMLHDVGSLPIVNFYERHREDISTLPAVVSEVADDLGTAVLTRWGFTDQLLETVGHAPCVEDASVLTQIVRAAHYEEDHGCLELLGLTPDDYFAAIASPERQELLRSLAG